MIQLLPCPGCNRHVRRSEPACPFCGADVAAAFLRVSPRPIPPSGLSRAALAAFAAASVATSACGGTTSGDPTGSGGVDGAGNSSSSGGATTGGKPNTGGVQGTGGFGEGVAAYGAPFYGFGSRPSYSGGGAGGANPVDGGESDAAPPGAGGAGVPRDPERRPIYGAPPARQ